MTSKTTFAQRNKALKELNAAIPASNFQRRRVEQSGLDHIWSLDTAGTFFTINTSKSTTRKEIDDYRIAMSSLSIYRELNNTNTAFQPLGTDTDGNELKRRFVQEIAYYNDDRANPMNANEMLERFDTDHREIIKTAMSNLVRRQGEIFKLYEVMGEKVGKYFFQNKKNAERRKKMNDLELNGSQNHILVAIDIFSRFLWTQPMINTDKETADAAFLNILERAGRKPKAYLWIDEGGEFEKIKKRNFYNENEENEIGNQENGLIDDGNEFADSEVFESIRMDDAMKQDMMNKYPYNMSGKNHTNKLKPLLKKTSFYHTHSKNKAVFAERVIGTLKKMLRDVPVLVDAFHPKCWNLKMNENGVVFSEIRDYEKSLEDRSVCDRLIQEHEWNDTFSNFTMLEYITWRYNHNFHRSLPLKMTPTDASNPQNEQPLLKHFYTDSYIPSGVSNFNVGERVRILQDSASKKKEYEWSVDVFTFAQIKSTSPITFKVRSQKGELLKKSFYSQELQKTSS